MASPEWADDPIESAEADVLQRGDFVHMVASRVLECAPGQHSTVYAIVGPWGSGKTSIANLVRAQVVADPGWRSVSFAPWSVFDERGLAAEFFATLISAIPEGDEKGKQARRQLGEYAKTLVPLVGAIPVVGVGFAGAADRSLDRVLKREPWDQAFANIAKVLAKLGYQLLVLVDDLDRLAADELMDVLKLVRLLGRLPNVHYLLLYDIESVRAAIGSKHGGDAPERFIEKIIQYPFDLPPLQESHTLALARRAIEALLGAVRVPDEESFLERKLELEQLVAELIDTPRNVARLQYQLESAANLSVIGDVDALDFVALTTLRTLNPSLYAKLPGHYELLRVGRVPEKGYKAEALSLDELREFVGGESALGRRADAYVQVLSFLFSAISFRGWSYFKDHQKAFCDDEYRERYWVGLVGDADVSDALVERALAALERGEDFESPDVSALTAILDGQDFPRVSLGYAKVRRMRRFGGRRGADVFAGYFRNREGFAHQTPVVTARTQALWGCFSAELAYGLAANSLDVADVRNWLTEPEMLKFLVRALGDARSEQLDLRPSLEPFADHFKAWLLSDFSQAIQSDVSLVGALNLIRVGHGDESVVGLIDGALAIDVDALDILSNFVEVKHWVSGSETSIELEFNNSLLEVAVAPEFMQPLVANGITSWDGAEPAPEDESLPNRRRYAAWAAKQIYPGFDPANLA